MRLGDLRAMTADLPDDAEVFYRAPHRPERYDFSRAHVEGSALVFTKQELDAQRLGSS